MNIMPPAHHLLTSVTRQKRKKVRSVLQYAETHLHSLMRRNELSYATHCKEVASTLLEVEADTSLICVALLHDILIHPKGATLLRHSPLDKHEMELVRTMHSLRRRHINENTRDLDEVIEAIANDERVLILRMAHRINDIRNLSSFSKSLQRTIAKESLHMYTAIAGRLGMHQWRYEMEDICFSFLQPTIAKKIADNFAKYKSVDTTCLEKAERYLRQKLKTAGISFRMDQRIKGLYSTYRKLILRKRTFEELTDRLALRIIVTDTESCYSALGVVHTVLRPIPGKLKDYIGAPKENGYQSIHTVIYPFPDVTEQPIEIQIRTEAMHKQCEYGITSHADYKHSMYALQTPYARAHLMRNLLSLRHDTDSPEKFESVLREYFHKDQIIIFDEEGILYHIKKPSTALDFIWHARNHRARHLVSVRINGRKSPFDTALKNGDIVEAQFARSVQLRKEWLQDCLRPLTKREIRDALKK